MAVIGSIKPLKDKIMVSRMNFGESKTKTGIVLTSDDGKSSGVHPRWGQVFAVGDEQTDVEVGEWVLVAHGRWTRGIKYEDANGEELEIRMIENDAILLVSDEPDEDVRVKLGALNFHTGA